MVFPGLIPREVDIPTNLDRIISLVGARRSGKTYVLHQLIGQLLTGGVKKEQILFLNFEDERLNLKVQDLDLIIQSYMELYPEMDMDQAYLFFDEIQNVSGWEKFVRRIFDTRSRHIFITGSNAKLLSTEIATELRGRTLSFTIYPLSYREFLRFNNVGYKIQTQSQQSKIIHFVHRFLEHGGFPETVQLEDRIRTMVHQEYFNVMIYRDIVERYQVANPEVLKMFIKKIFVGVTKPFSVNKAYNDIKSQGYKISNKYLYDYLEYCNAVFICRLVSKFDFSEMKQIKSDKKVYVIDHGLLASINFSISEDKGKLLENMVALELMKLELEVFYYKDVYECDFIVKNRDKTKAIQVSYALKEVETLERELRGLKAACSYISSNTGTIITLDEEDTLEYDGLHVDVVPAYKYFASKRAED